jgi:hypothetical protein
MSTSNTLTGIIPTLYDALNVVSRELVGFIPAVRRDTAATSAAVGQTVRSPIGTAGDLEDITPGADPANSGGTTTEYTDVTITKSKAAPILWSGEEQLSVSPFGLVNTILRDQFVDGMRKLCNAVEVDLAAAAKVNSSRAYGTAGTAPFGTAGDLSDIANLRKILEDNGCPTSDLQFVVNSASMANLRGKQSVLFKVNEAGSQDMLRDGMTDRLQGFALRNSAGISTHTKGTATLLDAAGGEPIGETDIALDGGDGGTLLAGDIVTFAGDTNKYVVNTGFTAVSGTAIIGKPGLRATLADTVEMTIGNSYTGNFGFDRNALVLAARAPAMPEGGDSADDVTTIQDPVSGLVFQVAIYRQYRRVKYEIGLAWGVAGPNGAHIATLLG